MAHSRSALLIFARTPVPGQVKTRLAAEVGPANATAAYVELAERTVAVARKVDGCERFVCFTPPDGEQAMRLWLGDDLRYEPQQGPDLGARMAHAISARLRDGFERVVVIGTDCPGIDRRTLVKAFDALARADLVVGPATDGGYYLIGLRGEHPEVFDDIPWSTNQALARTLAAARELRLTIDVLDIMWDVDTAEDLKRWRR